MAIKKPRITITLTEQQHAIFCVLSDSSGQSMSGIIGEFIESAQPVFERMAAIASQLRKNQKSELSRMRSNLDKVQDELEPLATIALDQLDMFFKTLDAPSSALDPRSVITGVTPPQSPIPSRLEKPLKVATGKASSKIHASSKSKGVGPAKKGGN